MPSASSCHTEQIRTCDEALLRVRISVRAHHTGGETGTQTTLGEIASEIMVTTGPDAEACELDEIDEVSDADDEEAMV